MAIPFYYPEPPGTPQHNSHGNNTVNLHGNRLGNSQANLQGSSQVNLQGNSQVNLQGSSQVNLQGNPQVSIPQASFLHQLLTELASVYLNLNQNRIPYQAPAPLPDLIACHTPSTDHSSSSEEDSISVKLQVECSYRSVGRDLRRIADNFQREGAEEEQSITFKLAFRLALPTVALLSWAYLRRS